MEDLYGIFDRFIYNGTIKEIKPMGSGHIHKTYLVKTSVGDTDDYVLQQINTDIFTNPVQVMKNIETVTSHIRSKLTAINEQEISRKVMTPLDSLEGNKTYTDSSGKVWRAFIYIKKSRTFDRAISDDQVYQGGFAYGRFLHMLSDLPADKVGETLSGFHNMALRIRQFDESCENGISQRIKETNREIVLLKERRDEMLIVQKMAEAGKIPERIVHHDTKINNVMFDEDCRALCVIDLDTVMPGTVHDDFGDSIRTFTNTGEEDDADLKRVSINMGFFESYSRGFLESAGRMLTSAEIDLLPISSRIMTYMQSLRFLTDYLKGDIYYRTHFPGHNLQRAKAQIQLMLSMESHFKDMGRIIGKLHSQI